MTMHASIWHARGFTRDEVAAIAALANLELDDDELDLFARQLGDILAYADEVQQIDTTGVPPTASVRRAPRRRPRRRAAAVARPRRGARQRARRRARRRPLQSAAGHRMTHGTVREIARARSDPAARSAVEVCREALARIDALDPALHAFNTVIAERALARAAAIDREPRSLARRAARRRADRAQGQPLHARRAHHRLVADARALRPALRRHRRRAPRARRRGDRRQDQLRRVRDGLVDRELGVRPGAQSVGARSHSRRLERRLGGRGRGRAWRRSRSAPTPADRSASRRRSAASSASSRPTAASRATACSRSPRRSIRSVR